MQCFVLQRIALFCHVKIYGHGHLDAEVDCNACELSKTKLSQKAVISVSERILLPNSLRRLLVWSGVSRQENRLHCRRP